MTPKKTTRSKRTAKTPENVASAAPEPPAESARERLESELENTFEDLLDVAAEIAQLATRDKEQLEQNEQKMKGYALQLDYPEMMALKAYRTACKKMGKTDAELTEEEEKQVRGKWGKAYHLAVIKEQIDERLDDLISAGSRLNELDENDEWIPQGARVPAPDAAQVEIGSEDFVFSPREQLYAREGILLAAHVYYQLELPLSQYDVFYALANTFACAFDAIRRDQLLDQALA